MSGNTPEGDSTFNESKIDLEDNDLQSQLYARIYYESNIDGESQSKDLPSMTQFDSMTDQSSLETEIQHKPVNEQSTDSQALKDKSAGQSVGHGDTLMEPVEYSQASINNKEASCTLSESGNAGDATPQYSLRNKKSMTNFAKKYKTSKPGKNDSPEDNAVSTNTEIYSKYNVLQKHMKREMRSKKLHESAQGDSSDSESSIFEIPVPPKPKPLLIDLQDSEEEDNTRLELKKCHSVSESWDNKDARSGNASSRVASAVDSASNFASKASTSRENTSSKNKSSSKFPRGKNISTDVERTLQTRQQLQQPREDMVLNCTMVQKGVGNINEIRHLSKNAEVHKNKSALNTERNQNSRKGSQNLTITHVDHVPYGSRVGSWRDDCNPQEEMPHWQELRKMHTNTNRTNPRSNTNFVRRVERSSFDNPSDEIRVTLTCSSSNAADRKRQRDNEIEIYSDPKRRCIIEPNDQNVPHCSNTSGAGGGSSSNSTSTSGNGRDRRKDQSSNEHLANQMPERLRNRYYSAPGQENFSVTEVQSGMSKNPQMWAILDEDTMPISTRQRVRFWNVKCTNCHQDGHRRCDCPAPRRPSCCYMCGMQGHSEFRCPKKICLTCGKQQSTYRKTCEFCRVLYCTMCNSIGHETQQCPDLWRRYHQTVSVEDVPPHDPGNVMKPPNLLHCCNCTKRGHESSTCNEYRWSQHFPTPAVVSNYIDGPVYATSTADSSRTDVETNASTSKVTDNREINTRRNVQQAAAVRVEATAGNPMALAPDANKPAIPKASCAQEAREDPLRIEFSCPPDQEKRKKKELIEQDFTKVVYGCGTCNYNKKDNICLWHNLSDIHDRPHFEKNKVMSSLMSGRTLPIFFEKLSEKIEFLMKIGFVRQHTKLMVLFIARQDYVNNLYQLLLHWIYIPDDEKDYGIDVTLPMSITKMYNLLSSRKPQLEKMRFTAYEQHIKFDENDPRYIFRNIKAEKSNLEHHKGTREYFRLRTKLWRSQIRLLMLANTEPQGNNYVSNFWSELESLSQKMERNTTETQLSVVTYLKLTLLYNRLFVPHTSYYVYKMLKRIEKYVGQSNETAKLQTKRRFNVTSYVQEIPAFCTLPPLRTVEEIQSPESPPLSEQGIKPIVSGERSNANDALPGTSDTTNNQRFNNEIFVIDDIDVPNSQTAVPLNTEPVQVEYIGQVKAQSSQQNAQRMLQPVKVTKNKKTHKSNISEKNYNKALRIINNARAFNLPHMMKAANILENKMKNNVVRKKDIGKLTSLINLETKHQKTVTKLMH